MAWHRILAYKSHNNNPGQAPKELRESISSKINSIPIENSNWTIDIHLASKAHTTTASQKFSSGKLKPKTTYINLRKRERS